MSKPKIRFKGCQGEWESSTFIGTFQFLKNNSLSRACLSDNGDVKNVHYGDVLIRFGENLDVGKEALPYISDGSYGRVLAKRCSLQDGDVIIADAAEDNTVGKATELMSVGNNTVVSGLHTIPCRPTFTFESCYLGYYLNSNAYHNQLLPLIQGTKICSISKHALEKTTVSYPPTLAEQRQIASYFRSLDGILSGCEARLSSLRRLKEGALQAFFPQQGETQPKLRFKGCQGEWESLEMASVFETKNGYTPSKFVDAYWENGSIPWFRMEDIRANGGILSDSLQHITPLGVKGSGLFQPYSIILATTATIGVHAMIIADSLANQQFTNFSIRKSLSNDFDPYFVYYAFFKIDKWCVANTNSGGLLSVDIKGLLKEPFYFPALPEQRLIANFFRTLDRRIELERQRLEKLKQLKAACLEKMFV